MVRILFVLQIQIIHTRREEREPRERDKEAQKQLGGSHEAGKLHTQQRKTDISDTEMDTEAGREVGTSQSHSRHKKGHMTNIR